MIESIFYVLLVLGGLIFIHELGHFLMARAFGMGVTTFSLGFGPKLFSFTRGKTEYCLSLVPLGGYCAMVGEEDASDMPEGFTAEENMALRPAWQRLLVVAAGPASNILIAWFICWGLAFGYGQQHIVPVIGQVLEDSPAQKAGIVTNDTILSIDGTPTNDWTSMAAAIAASEGKAMQVLIKRDDKDITLEIVPKSVTQTNIFGEEKPGYVIGVHSAGVMHHSPVGFIAAAGIGLDRTWEMVELTWMGFVKLFQRVVPLDQVGGPIMIAQMVGQQAEQGLAPVLALAALISINLGILNLLPIPVLDGGHIVFYTIEMIARRPVPIRAREMASRVGFFLLISLMILATFNDIWRIAKDFFN